MQTPTGTQLYSFSPTMTPSNTRTPTITPTGTPAFRIAGSLLLELRAEDYDPVLGQWDNRVSPGEYWI